MIAFRSALLALLAAAAPVRAADPVSLDFLGGDWVLMDPAGKPAGKSHIEVQLPGAMIFEKRTDADGELPVWFVNSESRGWVQLFPGPGGSLREFTPQSAPGAWPLVLGDDVTLGIVGTRSSGSRLGTPRIISLIASSKCRPTPAKTWSLVFDYRYVRAATP